MDALAISVGHNSSAVAIRDGEIIGGYEEERFTGKKSDSAFPMFSILELKVRHNLARNTNLFVSHWFPNGILEKESKYWCTSAIKEIFSESSIFTLNPYFTHHDAHMESARVFAGSKFIDNYHTIIVDGFGTHAEHISIYKHNKLIRRFFGYENSLGLFYQYATAFCGMKMHNHEYKMLAYETHVNEIKDGLAEQLDEYIDTFSDGMTILLEKGQRQETLDKLPETRQFVEKILMRYLTSYGFNDAHEWTKRILVSYFAQRHIENMMCYIVKMIKPTNLLLSGGVCYNVKLNNLLGELIPGKICVMPLAGDQGAGIGVYQRFCGGLSWPGHLFWGHRKFNKSVMENIDGIKFVKKEDMYKEMCLALDETGFVNVARGAMEFGPRALCNTSTLAFPTHKIGDQINQMNGRTNEMPFALVVTEEQARTIFEKTERVHKSLDYMIITRKFKKGYEFGREGGAHYYPLTMEFTCRPQVTRDPLMIKILSEYGPLINTSWNYHGVPIVRSTNDAIYTHVQEKQNSNVKFKTLIQEV